MIRCIGLPGVEYSHKPDKIAIALMAYGLMEYGIVRAVNGTFSLW
jgi:hypothetical protein